MAYKLSQSKESFFSLCKEANVVLPYSDDVSILKTPLEINGKTINNRIVYQAMEGCDGTASGVPDELTIRRYHRFANGGPGIIWFEATAVQKKARANPRQMYICDENIDTFKAFVEDVKTTCIRENGFEPLVICQLTHSGRYSKPNGYLEPIIAYNNPIFEKDAPIDKSRIITDEELDVLMVDLINGAALAEKCGFDGADIKCCHRYLMSELMSGYTRDGRYGGSFENRTRLFKGAVSGAIENCSKDFIITSRMNAYDGFPYPYGFGVNEKNGITPDYTEAVKIAEFLKEKGVTLLNLTMGNPYFNPHVNRPFANGTYEPPEHPMSGVARMLTGIKEIKSAVPELKIISSGISYLGTASANVSAANIKDGWYDFAGFGRETLAYPQVAREICENGGLDPKKICVACGKCTEIMRQKGGTPGCVIRDKEVYAPIYKKFVLNKEN